MTIRYLAEELYRWTCKVDELEKALAALEADAPERNRLAMELSQAKQEVARFRAVLEAKKEQPRI